MNQTPSPLALEQGLLRVLADGRTPRSEVLAVLRTVPTGAKLVLLPEWMAIARNTALEGWRRLAAYDLLIGRGVSYPSTWSVFASVALEPMGIREDALVDMSMAQYVPVKRTGNTTIRMAQLPFETSVGSAALYVSVRRAEPVVEEAATYPPVEAA